MSPRKFDRFMVDVNVGTNRKLRRLNPQERWCALAGVFAIAATSPIRGALLVGGDAADEVDYAEQAGVSVSVARSTVKKLRGLGVIYSADDGPYERVHDFEDWNPEPKNDPTAAERMKRYRARLAERNGVTRYERNGVTDTPGREEKVEEKTPPTPPRGGSEGNVVTFARRAVPAPRLAMAERLLDYFNERAKTSYGAFTGRGQASPNLQRIIGALTDHPNVDENQWRRTIKWRLANPFWDGKPHAGVVFGPGAVEGNLMSAMNGSSSEDVQRKLIGDGA